MRSEVLLADLVEMTQAILTRTEKFLDLSEEALNFKQDKDKWSALECLKHLNICGAFYIAEIRNSIQKSKRSGETQFRSGWFGNFFAKSMLPDEKMKKVKTFKSMNPVNSKLDKSVLEEFRNQQNSLLELLEQAKGVSLTANKTGIFVSKWIRIRLGDSFRVVIYHNVRHVIQAERAIRKTN